MPSHYRRHDDRPSPPNERCRHRYHHRAARTAVVFLVMLPLLFHFRAGRTDGGAALGAASYSYRDRGDPEVEPLEFIQDGDDAVEEDDEVASAEDDDGVDEYSDVSLDAPAESSGGGDGASADGSRDGESEGADPPPAIIDEEDDVVEPDGDAPKESRDGESEGDDPQHSGDDDEDENSDDRDDDDANGSSKTGAVVASGGGGSERSPDSNDGEDTEGGAGDADATGSEYGGDGAGRDADDEGGPGRPLVESPLEEEGEGEGEGGFDDGRKYWEVRASEEGGLDCKIDVPSTASDSDEATPNEHSNDGEKEQYVIHVHGIHHTGTGYLRQTLHDALNEAFSADDGSDDAHPSPPAASMQDSMRPYRDEFERAKRENDRSKLKELHVRHHKQEDEGQHLQTVYPRFYQRLRALKGLKKSMGQSSRLAYMADFCAVDDDRRVGSVLLRQWMRFWDRSATFLIQKTPTVDVMFMERVKVLPTLHVIVVRHPMTNNPWKLPNMGHYWLNAWAHVLETLRRGEIEWYAVVTYEALMSNHDEVVGELLEVVRSGMARHGSGRDSSGRTASSNARQSLRGKIASRPPEPQRRRLHLHDGKKSDGGIVDASYLAPKKESISLWEKCLNNDRCRDRMDRLTRDVFPYFGYVSLRDGKVVPLLSSPGTVTARREYGRVLYTSEGEALNEFRGRSREGNDDDDGRIVDYEPPSELITRMKNLSTEMDPSRKEER